MECECGNRTDFIETREDDLICTHCGVAVERGGGNFLRTIDGIDFDRCADVHHNANKLIAVVGPEKYAKMDYPKGWTYKAIFHGAERIAQLDCCDPEIPASILALIRREYTKHWKGKYIGKKEVGEILENLSWPADQKRAKNGKVRVKSVKKVFLERWIKIRFLLTGERPPEMPQDFKWTLKEKFENVVRTWQRIRHGNECPARWSSDRTCVSPRQNGCRHNLPNYNWMFQQLIEDIIHEDPIHYGFADAYLDYVPSLQTPKRVAKLEAYLKELSPHTKIPLYKIRALKER